MQMEKLGQAQKWTHIHDSLLQELAPSKLDQLVTEPHTSEVALGKVIVGQWFSVQNPDQQE